MNLSSPNSERYLILKYTINNGSLKKTATVFSPQILHMAPLILVPESRFVKNREKGIFVIFLELNHHLYSMMYRFNY